MQHWTLLLGIAESDLRTSPIKRTALLGIVATVGTILQSHSRKHGDAVWLAVHVQLDDPLQHSVQPVPVGFQRTDVLVSFRDAVMLRLKVCG
jgi:hypothetical protein